MLLRTPFRTTATVIATAALLLAACGGDDAAGADDERFCELLAAPMSEDDTEDDLAEDLDALVEAAPDEIADEMQRLSELFTELQEFDFATATDDEIADVEAVLEEFDPLSADVEAWALDHCDGVSGFLDS